MKKFIFILLGILPFYGWAQIDENFRFNGFVDTYHAVRTQSPNDFMSSRTRFRGEFSKAYNRSSMFVSFNLNQNSLLKKLNGFELREAYIDYTAEHWSLRAGRQLVIWGAADGVRITDLVLPMDLTEFLARDYDDIRMPVEALKFGYFKNSMKLELVYILVFKGFILPTNPKNPWAIPLPEKAIILAEEKPNFTIKNSEFGGRLTFNLQGIDFSLAGLYTFNKMPVFNSFLDNGKPVIRPEYHRMTFIGGDFSKPLGAFVLRGETTFNIHKTLETNQFPTILEDKNTLNYLLGLDWYAPNEWLLSTQFSDELIFDYSDNLKKSEHSPLMTFNISKTLLNSTLKLSDFIYTDLENSSFFNRFSADYSLSDQIHFLVGYDYFQGDKGLFGFYENNSEVWGKMKYSF